MISEKCPPIMSRFLYYTVAPLFRTATENLLKTLDEMQFTPLEEMHLRPGQFTKLLDQDAIKVHKFGQIALGQAALRSISYWLKYFAIGDELEMRENGSTTEAVITRSPGFDTPVSQLGFGHRRLLSFLLSLSPEKKGLRLLEEPEANLHPNLQSKLADVFVHVSKESPRPPSDHGEVVHGVRYYGDKLSSDELEEFYTPTHQLIVETHSEYLIRRLQYLVATGVASPEDVAIYYLGPDPSAEDYIKRITIAPSGKLSESFGPGFTDEATNLMIDLYKQTHQN